MIENIIFGLKILLFFGIVYGASWVYRNKNNISSGIRRNIEFIKIKGKDKGFISFNVAEALETIVVVPLYVIIPLFMLFCMYSTFLMANDSLVTALCGTLGVFLWVIAIAVIPCLIWDGMKFVVNKIFDKLSQYNIIVPIR